MAGIACRSLGISNIRGEAMRISRPCYDKIRRCPGWAGGGMRFAKVDRCDNGMLDSALYGRRCWRWRLNRCPACGVLVLPYAIRWIDPSWWRYRAGLFKHHGRMGG